MQPGTGRASRRSRVIILVSAVIVMVAALTILFGSQARTLITFRKVDDYPLYVMHFYGSYGFEDFLQQGIRASAGLRPTEDRPEPGWACTVFASLDGDGDLLLGRNFDWHNRPTLLLFTHPPEGYDSVSLVDISYLGFDGGTPPWIEVLRLRDAPYWPFDGMNEQGLAVGMMAVPHAQDRADPLQTTISGLQAMRLILDQARSVDEAIALLREYHIDFDGGPPLHYLVADRKGTSAIIEFIDGEMKVLRNQEPWQVATNFLMSGRSPEAAKTLCPRYARAYHALEQGEGALSPMQAMAILEDVSQPNTMWSVVYGLTTGDIAVSMGGDHEQVYSFDLQMQN